MTQWFSPVELVGLALPNIPGTERGIREMAKRESWESRPRQGRGGGKEYPETALPEPARKELEARRNREAAKQALAVTAEQQQRQIATVAPAALTARQRQVMEARAAVLLELDRLVNVDGMTRNGAIMHLVNGTREGTLAPELMATILTANDKGRGLCRAGIYNWLAVRERGNVTSLAPQPTRQKEKLPHWFGAFFRYYAKPGKPKVTAALANWQRDFPGEQLPSYRQVRIALSKLGTVERQRGRMGVQALKTLQAYKSRDTSDLLPSSVYVADGKTYDAEIAHPIHGQPFRPELTTIIDAHTRKVTGFSISLDENRFGVLDALRVACCYAGIPALFYTDNGPGYVNETMTHSLTGFLARLSITPMNALPYNSQAKGIIERLNRMWSEDAKQYATFIGKDMDKDAKKAAFKQTRKELAMFGQSRLLPSWEEFRANCLASIDRYNNTPHSSLPRISDPETGRQRFMTPNEMWEAACARGFEPVLVTADEAEDLFRPWITRKVSRCMVTWLNNEYFSLALEQYHGAEVIMGYDISDASKVWVREIDLVDGERAPGRLIAVAEFGGNKTRYVPVSYEQDAMERRAKGRKRRLEKKIDVADQELRPSKLLEARPVAPVVEIKLAPEPVAVAAAKSEPVRMMPNGRPRFSNDIDFVKWLLANPSAVTQSDREYIRDEVIDTHTGKEVLRRSGIDLDAVRSLLRSAA